MDKTRIGIKLRNKRGAISVRNLAHQCQVTESAIRNYENGERIPADIIKIRLANALGSTVQELFYDD